MFKLVCLLVTVCLNLETVSSFSIQKSPTFLAANSQSCLPALGYASKDEEATELATSTEDELAGAEIIDFFMENHRPLGCTVEESLANPSSRLVFVTRIVEGGFAEKAGLKVGDVIVGLSGMFGDMTEATGIGIEEVKKLVAGRPEKEPLEIRVARGTTVEEKHESALVDLCSLPGADDKEIEQCVTTFLNYDFDETEDDVISHAVEECDAEAECLLDKMVDMWQDDDVVPKSKEEEPMEEPVNGESNPRPWSSRSSPSGTFVRDPTTGEMENIDK